MNKFFKKLCFEEIYKKSYPRIDMNMDPPTQRTRSVPPLKYPT